MAILKEYQDAQMKYARELAEILVKLHVEEYPKHYPDMNLIAAMLYGELAEGSSDEWVRIFEIVKNYPYPYNSADPIAKRFKSTKQFPWRGSLILSAVSPEEFEDAIREELSIMEEITEYWTPLFDPEGYLRKHLGEPR